MQNKKETNEFYKQEKGKREVNISAAIFQGCRSSYLLKSPSVLIHIKSYADILD